MKKHLGAVSLLIAAAGILSVAMPAGAQTATSQACQPVTRQQVAALFTQWNDDLLTRNPDKIVADYAPDAVLLPTVSNKARTTPAEIRDYFVHFMAGKPSGSIDHSYIKIGCNTAQNVGTYTFKFANGKVVHARYTYVYQWENGKWLIVHHHSSAMPQKH